MEKMEKKKRRKKPQLSGFYFEGNGEEMHARLFHFQKRARKMHRGWEGFRRKRTRKERRQIRKEETDACMYSAFQDPHWSVSADAILKEHTHRKRVRKRETDLERRTLKKNVMPDEIRICKGIALGLGNPWEKKPCWKEWILMHFM